MSLPYKGELNPSIERRGSQYFYGINVMNDLENLYDLWFSPPKNEKNEPACLPQDLLPETVDVQIRKTTAQAIRVTTLNLNQN